MQAREKAAVEGNLKSKARAIEQLLLDVMGFLRSTSGTTDLPQRLALDVKREDLEIFYSKTPCLRSDCNISCSHCKLWSLLQERHQDDMSPELQELVKQVALQPDVRPTGSFRFKSVKFPGDVDLFEYLIFEASSEKEALFLLCQTLKKRAEDLKLFKNIFFSGLKAGKDPKGQYFVWNLDELQAGRKEYQCGKVTKEVTLQEALEEGHITGTAKIDVYARIPLLNEQNRRFFQVTNVIRLGFLPKSEDKLRKRSEDKLRKRSEDKVRKRSEDMGGGFSIQPVTKENDHLRAVERDLRNYSGAHPKMMKYLKRLWERSAFLAQRGFDLDFHVKILEAIQPVFQHWVARLGAIADHVETLWYMLDDRDNPKMQEKSVEDIASLRNLAKGLGFGTGWMEVGAKVRMG